MAVLLQFPFTDSAPVPHRPESPGMRDAPRDGTPIWVIVAVGGENGQPARTAHWLEYPVRWFNGEWRYARLNTKLFPWHQKLQGWSLDKPECLS